MKFYYCMFYKNWADEFDYEKHFILTEEKKLELEKEAEETQDIKFNYNFGTNEGWEDINLKELVDSIRFKEIDEYTYDMLSKFLDTYFPLEYEIEDEEEEYEDD